MLTERIFRLISIGLCAFVLGCGPGGDKNADRSGPDNGGTPAADAHDHSHEGPHGGHVIVLGDEEYHASHRLSAGVTSSL